MKKNTNAKDKYIKLIDEAMKHMSKSDLMEYFTYLKDFSSTNRWYEKTIDNM